MNANRCYFAILVLFLLYISLSIHEISNIIRGQSVSDEGKRNEFWNRSFRIKLDESRYCRSPRVAVLVSASEQQYIQIYWDVEFAESGDWIGLFKEDPQCREAVFPIYTEFVKTHTGIVETNFTATPQILDTEFSFASQCLGFWAVYFSNTGTAAAVTCLKTNPTWMHDMRQHLEQYPIKRIFIPGTHDSGSYTKTDDASSLHVVHHYVFTQDEDIFNQLIYGIRYLDLRVSSNPHLSDRWWVNHGIVRIQPLKNVIQDVKKFLGNTKEIIILDFHGFPVGFTQGAKTHHELVDYIQSELSEWMAPPDWNSPCGSLWEANKTLIVSYNHQDTQSKYSAILWTPVSQKWANVQDTDSLKEYFYKIIESRPSYSWAAMAELTPTLWSIITQQTNSLRRLAKHVNLNVTTWFRGIWGRSCNIVAVDFFRSTDIVEAAIEWNVRKNRKHICDIH